MTKMQAAVAKLTIVETSNREIAFYKGRIARAYNRPNSGALVPKLENEDEHEWWMRGWAAADAELTQAE